MTQSLVLELQAIASDSKTDINTVLSKAKLVAGKLKIQEFQTWLNKEVNGYEANEEVPPYRKLSGELKAHDAVYGRLIPFLLENKSLSEMMRRLEVKDPIGKICHHIDETDGVLTYSISQNLMSTLMRIQTQRTPLVPVIVLDNGSMASIVHRVRETIVDWSLDLEAQGILGEGMTFNMSEKSKANEFNSSINSVFTYIGNNANGNSINQNIEQWDMSNRQALHDIVRSLGADEQDVAELDSAIDSDAKHPQVNKEQSKIYAWTEKMIDKVKSGGIAISGKVANSLIVDHIKGFLEGNN